MRLVSVGEVTLDHYLSQAQVSVGGISLNFAIHAKRAGVQNVSLISRVGHEDAQIVLDTLKQESIDTTFVQVLEGKTASIEIDVLADGDRVFPEGGYRANVLENFRLSHEELRFIQKQDILVTYYTGRTNSHFQQLRNLSFSGKRVADFGDWARRKHDLELLLESLEHIDLVFISGNEEAVEALSPYSSKNRLIIVTLGAAGSVALVAGKLMRQEAQKVKAVVDTTGCGDAFQAAFTVHYFQTGNIRGALAKGALQAARVLKHYGAH